MRAQTPVWNPGNPSEAVGSPPLEKGGWALCIGAERAGRAGGHQGTRIVGVCAGG